MKSTGQPALTRLAIYSALAILTLAAPAVASPEAGLSDKAKNPKETERVVATSVNQAGNSIVINVSKTGILAMCGTFDYVDPLTGETHRGATWKRSFVGPFVEMELALPPGGVYEFNPDPHPMRTDLKLYQINIEVTGVLLDGGAALGRDADYIRAKVMDTARDTRLQLMEIRDTFRRKGMKENQELMCGIYPIIPSGRMREYVHLKLQQRLLTGYPPKLRSDYMERLEELVLHLGKF